MTSANIEDKQLNVFSNQPETKLYHTFITIAYIVFSLAYIPNTMSAQTESIPARVAPQNSQSASNGTEISEKHVFGPADKKANGIVGPPMRPLVRRPTPMNLKIPPGLIKKASPLASSNNLIEEEEESS